MLFFVVFAKMTRANITGFETQDNGKFLMFKTI